MVRAVQAGARGYVVKDVDTAELVRAIRAISAGESAFDSRSAAAVVRSLSGRTGSRQQLTDREIEVLRLLAAGFSNQKIGERLLISATTAKFHINIHGQARGEPTGRRRLRREQATPDLA